MKRTFNSLLLLFLLFIAVNSHAQELKEKLASLAGISQIENWNLNTSPRSMSCESLSR